MAKLTNFTIRTESLTDFVNITEDVRKTVRESGIKDGLVAVITAHTTTGITVNEGLDCVMTDIGETLENLVPQDAPYKHAHFLPSYGATGSNAPGHLKSMLCGNHCLFPIEQGEIVLGHAQDIFLAEFDGPQNRKIYIKVIGE